MSPNKQEEGRAAPIVSFANRFKELHGVEVPLEKFFDDFKDYYIARKVIAKDNPHGLNRRTCGE